MKINKVETMIRIKELKEEISKIDGEILILQKQMEEAMKPFKEKIDKLSKQRNELQNELNRLKHSMEYVKFEEFVKYRKDKMTLKELILKGEGTFGDYLYFLPSGTAVKPSIFLKIDREFENLETFAKYLKKLLGEIKHIDYGLSGIIEKYTEGRVECYDDTPVEVAKKLYLNGFIVGWNGEIYVRRLDKNVRYVRNIDKIIVVKKGKGVKS